MARHAKAERRGSQGGKSEAAASRSPGAVAATQPLTPASPARASPGLAILSTSPVKGSGAGGAGDRVPPMPALAGQSPTGGAGSASGLGGIFSTSPWPREQRCYLQVMNGGSSPAAILGTLPKTSSNAGSAGLVLPGSPPTDGSATTPARFAYSGGAASSKGASRFYLDEHNLPPSGARTPRSDEDEEAFERQAEELKDAEDSGVEGPSEPSSPHSPYCVKNTFIETPLQRSPSFEKFFGIRKVHSSPPSVVVDLRDTSNAFMVSSPTGSEVTESEVESTVGTAARLLEKEIACSFTRSSQEVGSGSDLGGSTSAGSTLVPPLPVGASAGSGQISDASQASKVPTSAGPIAAEAAGNGGAADDGVVGSAEVPSRGSALHKWGACKPCAFVAQGVCRNDVNCQFCHLCEPGEKKRRRKEWLESKREARRSTEDPAPVNQQPQQQPTSFVHPMFQQAMVTQPPRNMQMQRQFQQQQQQAALAVAAAAQHHLAAVFVQQPSLGAR